MTVTTKKKEALAAIEAALKKPLGERVRSLSVGHKNVLWYIHGYGNRLFHRDVTLDWRKISPNEIFDLTGALERIDFLQTIGLIVQEPQEAGTAVCVYNLAPGVKEVL
jgi:hypothetical protein